MCLGSVKRSFRDKRRRKKETRTYIQTESSSSSSTGSVWISDQMADEEEDLREPAEVPLQWSSRKTRACIVCHLIKTEDQVKKETNTCV